MAVKKIDTNCGPLRISMYVGVPYGMTQLSINTVAAPVDVTVVTGISLMIFVHLVCQGRYVLIALFHLG